MSKKNVEPAVFSFKVAAPYFSFVIHFLVFNGGIRYYKIYLRRYIILFSLRKNTFFIVCSYLVTVDLDTRSGVGPATPSPGVNEAPQEARCYKIPSTDFPQVSLTAISACWMNAWM